jgi:2-dehydro-3-deoxyphosphogluconate aldolase / (4S)-4-hydroxy-2-oxoglutarate aldolase
MPQMTRLDLILEGGIIAIMRAKSSDQLIEAAEAVEAGGINVIEVTMTTPGALSVIEQAVSKFSSKVLFGAGSVLDAETARAAILAGAQFVVCPTFRPATIEMCKRYSIPVMPGAYTPTEILSAWEMGADVVKIFPASVGGPGLIKALKGPLPQIRMAAVGGVDLSNTAQFFKAGVDAVGIGGELVSQSLLDNKDFAAITERAAGFRREADKGRKN